MFYYYTHRQDDSYTDIDKEEEVLDNPGQRSGHDRRIKQPGTKGRKCISSWSQKFKYKYTECRDAIYYNSLSSEFPVVETRFNIIPGHYYSRS